MVRLLKDFRFITIMALSAVAISLIVSLQWHSVEPFEIEDKCGMLINLESHTIEDAEICKSRCRTQCISKDFEYRKADFTQAELGCHTCVCYCK